MRNNRSVMIAALVVALLLCVSSSKAFTHTKPLVRIGMSRSELRKALPHYAKEFASSRPYVAIQEFDFHGMKGKATFNFRDDHLLVFIWERLNNGTALSDADVTQYAKMLRGLQADWGPGRSQPSSSDPRIQECFWHMPNARGHITYSPKSLKFQMMDSTFLESVIPHRN
jgi:hypothetical protein